MRISPLLSQYASPEFAVGERDGMRIALTGKTTSAAGVADLSVLRKWTLCGPGASRWLESKQIVNPGLLTRSVGATGLWAVRLGHTRYLISEDIVMSEATDATSDAETFVIAQDWVEFALFGAPSVEILSELCSTHLAQYDTTMAWIPTLLAEMEVALYQRRPNHYRVLCAPAEGPYVFSTLAARVQEAGGAMMGFDDYRNFDSK